MQNLMEIIMVVVVKPEMDRHISKCVKKLKKNRFYKTKAFKCFHYYRFFSKKSSKLIFFYSNLFENNNLKLIKCNFVFFCSVLAHLNDLVYFWGISFVRKQTTANQRQTPNRCSISKIFQDLLLFLSPWVTQ